LERLFLKSIPVKKPKYARKAQIKTSLVNGLVVIKSNVAKSQKSLFLGVSPYINSSRTVFPTNYYLFEKYNLQLSVRFYRKGK
jgi:hypothetical protein